MTVAFKTFGCRLNRAETAQFEAAFVAAGFTRVPFGAPARVLVVHSCAVTQRAEDEGLKLLRGLRRRWPDACLVAVGCAVEAAGEGRLLPLGLDLIIPRAQKDRLAETVLQHLGLPLPSPRHPPVRTTQRALLKVQDGCAFPCSYCIVPQTRGAPHSRPLASCLAEARALLAAGYRELVVTGCNTACYADGPHRLPDLLTALLGLPELGRLRLGSIEPGTVENEVFALMAEQPKLCRFLHLPIQSGDDAVLRDMRRRYTVAEVRRTLDAAYARLPDLALGADFICGFPGETPEAFARTVALAQAFPFSLLHVFPYSERPGTPAATLPGALPQAQRAERAQALIAVGKASRAAYAQRFVGRPVTLLVEHFDPEGRARGWSGERLGCAVADVPRTCRGTLCAFTPESAHDGTLFGRLT